jgi:hypothetical protein
MENCSLNSIKSQSCWNLSKNAAIKIEMVLREIQRHFRCGAKERRKITILAAVYPRVKKALLDVGIGLFKFKSFLGTITIVELLIIYSDFSSKRDRV